MLSRLSGNRFFNLAKICLCLTLLCSQQLVAEEKPFKLGIISGLTGMAAKWNKFQNMGAQLAAEELNAQGFAIELKIEDSQTQAPKVISAFNKLIDFDQVEAVLIDDFGFVAAPLLPLAKQRQKFLVALSLPHQRYCDQAPGYFYSLTSQFSESVPAFEKFFRTHPELKKIALVCFDDPEWGHTYQEIWTSLAKKYGVEVVDLFLSNDGLPDYKSLFTRLAPKKPQAIFLAHEPETFFKAVKQFHYQGLVVSANHALELFADSPAPRPELAGVYIVDPKISAEFRSKFVARFNRLPVLEAYSGYEAVRAIAKAAQQDRKHPERAMKDLTYAGVAGQIKFEAHSCAGNWAQWELFQFERDGAEMRVVQDSQQIE